MVFLNLKVRLFVFGIHWISLWLPINKVAAEIFAKILNSLYKNFMAVGITFILDMSRSMKPSNCY